MKLRGQKTKHLVIKIIGMKDHDETSRCTSRINEKHRNDALFLICEIPVKHNYFSNYGNYKLF